MHVAAGGFIHRARKFLESDDRAVDIECWNVVEIGSRDINGRASSFWGSRESWYGIDIADGPNVDEVGDAELVLKRMVKTLEGANVVPFDLAISAEVFEHASNWRGILKGMCKVADYVLVTCAGEGRPPHSAIDGGVVRVGEYYANVTQDEMEYALRRFGMETMMIEYSRRDGDLYVLACSM